MKKICYILRGISGSGKSTKAKELAGSTGVIHSTDDFFMINDLYIFNSQNLGINHKKNFEAFQNSIKNEISPVVIDNTNSRKWEYQNYIDFAKSNDYEVEIIQMPHIDIDTAVQRNLHGVPKETIKRMIERWEY